MKRIAFHRSLVTLVLCLVSPYGFSDAACAQQSPFARVALSNMSRYAGETLADVVIPLASGRLHAAPRLVTALGRPCQVEVMGARWPDGSIRYLRLDMPVSVTAFQRKTVELFVHKGSNGSFNLHPHLAAQIGRAGVWFWANGQRIAFSNPVVIEDGHAVKVLRSALRVKDSALWAELILIVPSDQPHARFYLSWGNSNPRVEDLGEWPTTLGLEVQGIKLNLEGARSKVLSRFTSGDGMNHGVLLHYDGNPIADGQAQCFEGIFYLGANVPRVRALAHGWPESMAFGPFGELFPDVPVSNAEFEKMIEEDLKMEVMDPWGAAVFGCNPDPRNTGDQRDFGVIVMREDLVRADPRRLGMISRSVFQEYCRPHHHLEYDLSPVTLKNHPWLLMIGARPHFRAGAWVDRLGKPARYIRSDEYARDPNGRRFRAHDDQHLSINFLSAFALTTGDRMARRECERHVEWWLGEYTVASGTYNDDSRAARATGRSLMAGSWLYLVTARADLRQRIEQRTKKLWLGLLEPRSGEPALLPGVLVPRNKVAQGHFWAPWEEALAIVGAMAVHRLFATPEALLVASAVSTNLVAHGIGVTPRGWRVGYFVPFASAPSTPYFALADPNFSGRSAGSGLTCWAMPAIAIAAKHSWSPAIRGAAFKILMDLISDSWFMGFVEPFNWLGVVPRK